MSAHRGVTPTTSTVIALRTADFILPPPMMDHERTRENQPYERVDGENAPGAEIVPGVVEIENGGSSGPSGVARTAFHQERRNRHEEKVQEAG
jgi:hypothetical protein